VRSTIVTLPCHAYTHVDAPSHFLVGGRDVAQMPVDQWVGDGCGGLTRVAVSRIMPEGEGADGERYP